MSRSARTAGDLAAHAAGRDLRDGAGDTRLTDPVRELGRRPGTADRAGAAAHRHPEPADRRRPHPGRRAAELRGPARRTRGGQPGRRYRGSRRNASLGMPPPPTSTGRCGLEAPVKGSIPGRVAPVRPLFTSIAVTAGPGPRTDHHRTAAGPGRVASGSPSAQAGPGAGARHDVGAERQAETPAQRLSLIGLPESAIQTPVVAPAPGSPCSQRAAAGNAIRILRARGVLRQHSSRAALSPASGQRSNMDGPKPGQGPLPVSTRHGLPACLLRSLSRLASRSLQRAPGGDPPAAARAGARCWRR